NARVLLTEHGTTLQTAATTAHGVFALTTPDSGRFEIRVAADGFRVEPIAIDATVAAHDLGDVSLSVSAISETLVVSASQVEIPLSQASSAVTVITGAELRDRQIATVAEALRSVPGLTVLRSGGAGTLTSVFPRGG